MHFTDMPIELFQDDRLNRSNLVKSLARAYNSSTFRTNGFIWALNGQWGAGKTSFIELFCLHLTHLEMARLSDTEPTSNCLAKSVTTDDLVRMAAAYKLVAPAVKRYAGAPEESRWYDPHRIAEFGRLTATVEERDDADHYWRLKRALDRDSKHIIVKFNPWIFAGRSELATALFSEIGRAIGTQLDKDAKRSFAKLLVRLSTLSAPVSALTGMMAPIAGPIMKLGLDGLGAYAASLLDGQPIDELKLELSDSLSLLRDKSVLVIIDDLDRLQVDEFVEIVSLLKTLCQLSNINYLLIYDDEIAEKATSSKLLSQNLRG